MKKSLVQAMALGALTANLLAGVPAFAQTATANFDVTITIIKSCTINAAPLNFGSSVGLLTAAIPAQSNLTVTCTLATPYTVGLSPGTGPGNTETARKMYGTGSGNTTASVSYGLFRDAAFANNWGDTAVIDRASGTGTGLAQTLTVYGNVPVQSPTPAPDTYKSTVTATVYF